jgi:hypothetical protein
LQQQELRTPNGTGLPWEWETEAAWTYERKCAGAEGTAGAPRASLVSPNAVHLPPPNSLGVIPGRTRSSAAAGQQLSPPSFRQLAEFTGRGVGAKWLDQCANGPSPVASPRAGKAASVTQQLAACRTACSQGTRQSRPPAAVASGPEVVVLPRGYCEAPAEASPRCGPTRADQQRVKVCAPEAPAGGQPQIL